MQMRRVLAISAIITVCRPTCAAVSIFPELEKAVDLHLHNRTISGIPISVTGSIVFPHELEVREGMAVSIESSAHATFCGGSATRFFFLQNNSRLSLSNVNLVGGSVAVPGMAPCSDCFGGAIFVSPRGVLTMISCYILHNSASVGGAIYAIHSSVTATHCTMTSNSAQEGGAVFADDASTVIATDCIINIELGPVVGWRSLRSWHIHRQRDGLYDDLKLGFGGGAVFAFGDSTVIATDCTMTSNSASEWGGAFYAGRRSTVIATDCTMTQTRLIVGWCSLRSRRLNRHRNRLHDDLKLCA